MRIEISISSPVTRRLEKIMEALLEFSLNILKIQGAINVTGALIKFDRKEEGKHGKKAS